MSALRWVRRAIRRAGVRLRYGAFSGCPILFANSFPKSGTHLLTQVLKGFVMLGPAVDSGLSAIVTFDGPTGKPRSEDVILRQINRLRSGDIAYGHLHALPEFLAALTRQEMATFFIYRDPRDVVVSHVHYVTVMEPEHVHHRYYTKELRTFDERLNVSILGRPDAAHPFPDIYQRFKPYLGWLDASEVLSMKFEDIIERRTAALERILDHAVRRGFRLKVSKERALQLLDSSIQPEKSPTFRNGKIGKWQDSFTDGHIALFKEAAGDLLIRLGYEQDRNW
jgi:hypothetical protein